MTTFRGDESNHVAEIPILITSSIIPHDTGVKLSDPQVRLFHALESIEQWTKIAPKSRIILCDGSNFDFEPIVKERFPFTSIECLRFENDQLKIATFGRGYGEGEIVKFALNHSAYLCESDTFVKCSSKLWVENYAECVKKWRGDCLFSGVFKNTFSALKSIEMIQVDTRFYVVQNSFYRKNLIDAHHKIGLTPGFGLEDSFHQVLRTTKQHKYLFAIPPVIKGVGGGTGTYYKSSWLRIWKEKIRLRNVKNTPDFGNLFDI